MEFYIIQDDKQLGPFGIEELNARGLKPDTPVWAEGMKDWAKASEVPALDSAIISPAEQQQPYIQGTPTAEGTGAVPPQWNAPQAPIDEEKPKSNRGWIIAAVVIVILAIFAFTNPSAEKHRDAVKNELVSFVDDAVDVSTNADSSFIGSIIAAGTKMFTGPALDVYLATNMDVNSYFLFSVGKLQVGDKTRTVSFGVLGHVFTFDKEDLALAIEKAAGIAPKLDDQLPAADQQQEQDANAASEQQEQQSNEDASLDSAANQLVDSVANHVKSKAKQATKKAAADLLKRAADALGN